MFGYHVTGSTGTLFLYGIVVGALALFGLSLLLAGVCRTSRRGREARHGLRQSRRETAAVSQYCDDLISQRDTARAYTASTLGNGQAPADHHPAEDDVAASAASGTRSGTGSASPQAQPVNSQPGPDIPAGDVSRRRARPSGCEPAHTRP